MLTVVMTTYAPVPERARYAREAVDGLLDNLVTGNEPVNFIIADDGSPSEMHDGYYSPLAQRLQSCGIPCVVTNADRSGIGGSLNYALKLVADDGLWFYITDDWVLTRRLDISPAIRLIRDVGYDYVRLNPLHPNLVCKTQFHEPIGWWLHLNYRDPAGGFYFATRPFIATKRFYQLVGPFKEYADAYDTERDYSDRISKVVPMTLGMAALVDMHGPWLHIGEYEVGTIQLEKPVNA